MKARDLNIAKASTMELNLSTRSIKSKKVYNRKTKHKGYDLNYAKDSIIVIN